MCKPLLHHPAFGVLGTIGAFVHVKHSRHSLTVQGGVLLHSLMSLLLEGGLGGGVVGPDDF